MKTIKGYKFIQKDMKSKNGNHTWEVGTWYKEEEIKICKKGFHACETPRQAFEFIYGNKFFLIEARGEIIKEKDKFVASEMRLIKELPLKKIAVKYACACARDCLGHYTKKYPNDTRVSDAIQAAEDYLDGKIMLEKLQAAESAARSAWSAAESAAWSAAESAAWSAARSAARSARSAARSAESAARSAESAARSAWSAAESAESAAWSAARSAWSAAESAAWSAAESAARKRQDKILNEIVKKYIKERKQEMKA